jgi:hypothetical protein
MGNYQEDILDMIAVDTGENIYDDSLVDLNNISFDNKRFILIDPSGKYIIFPNSKDEINYPNSLIINNFLINELVDNVLLKDLHNYINKFLEDYEWIINKDLIIKEIFLEVYFRKKGYSLTSGT